MSHLIGSPQALGWVVLKASLVFVVAVVGLIVSRRRVLAELNVVDLVATVTVGAVVGRTATSSSTALVTGEVVLTTLLALHRVVATPHRKGRLGGPLDRRPLVLLAQGAVKSDGLRRSGLTRRDAHRLSRQARVGEPVDLDYLRYEEPGALTVVRRDDEQVDAIRAGLSEAGMGHAVTRPHRSGRL